jgi:hypothetical protein
MLGVTAEAMKSFRERAKSEGLALAAWLRVLAFRELRRKPGL